MLRLVLPVAGAAAFFLLSLATVRLVRPREPRRYFLVFAAGLLIAAAWLYARLWPLGRPDDAIGLAAVLLVQALLCLTMWNAFYSLLWGFSGGLCHDLLQEPRLRRLDWLVQSYQGEGELDRILARRLPNLARGGYLDLDGAMLRLRPKGQWIARGTLAAFRVFSLGRGGGVKE
jgi:hypothetical protein